MKHILSITIPFFCMLVACQNEKPKSNEKSMENIQKQTAMDFNVLPLIKQNSQIVIAVDIVHILGGISTDLGSKYLIKGVVADVYKGNVKKGDTVIIKLHQEPNYLKDKEGNVIFQDIPFKEKEKYIVFLKEEKGPERQFSLMDKFFSVHSYDDYFSAALKSDK